MGVGALALCRNLRGHQRLRSCHSLRPPTRCHHSSNCQALGRAVRCRGNLFGRGLGQGTWPTSRACRSRSQHLCSPCPSSISSSSPMAEWSWHRCPMVVVLTRSSSAPMALCHRPILVCRSCGRREDSSRKSLLDIMSQCQACPWWVINLETNLCQLLRSRRRSPLFLSHGPPCSALPAESAVLCFSRDGARTRIATRHRLGIDA